MDHWNKGGLSREEFLRMRENALRQLQELAKKQQAFANVDKAPAQNSSVMKNSSEKVLSAHPEEKPQQTAPEKMQDAAVARPKEADLQTPAHSAGSSRSVGCRRFFTWKPKTCLAK